MQSRKGRWGVLALILWAPLWAAETGNIRWVHGSRISAHTTPSPTGYVLTHFTANQKVQLLSEQGEWCAVAWGRDSRVFVACRQLGVEPLSLERVGQQFLGNGANPEYAPLAAFWIAPSIRRLSLAGAYYDQTMLSESQRRDEHPDIYRRQDNDPAFNWEERKPPAPRPRLAEFDAMKKLFQDGAVAADEMRPVLPKAAEIIAAHEGKRTHYVDGRWIPEELPPLLSQGRFGVIKPSLFKSREEVAPGAANVEQLSAQFGIREKLRVTSGPSWIWERHGEPYVAGFWDVGNYELTLERPVVEYVVGRQGLLAAMEWSPKEIYTLGGNDGCDSGFSGQRRGQRRMAGYPDVKDPLVWIQTPAALPYKKAAIKTYGRRLELTGKNNGFGEGGESALLVVYEVDLDGDDVPDLSVWEKIGSYQPQELPEGELPTVLRVTFVNVAGEWLLLDTDYYVECT